MLSAKKTSPDKSIQGEVQLESKDTSAIMNKLIHSTATSEGHQISVSCETKTERNLKESEKYGKQDYFKSETVDRSKNVEIEMEDRSRNVEVKMEDMSKNTKVKTEETNIDDRSENIEAKIETARTEDKGSKSPGDASITQDNEPECRMTPIVNKSNAQKPSNVAVPRKCPPLSTPILSERPLVLTTHLVPSLPISLFEILVEAIEVATEKPVVLLYESRSFRPVAKEVADIAVLPASEEWENGELLPVSFCFEHHLNKSNSPCIYADVVVAADRAPHVKDITDLRGHRCSLPDRKKKIGAAALLFNYLHAKGESPAFFGNTLDADTQLATLQMVAGKQVEIGILESPIIKCHTNTLPGINSLHILTSLGPLPPYRIMAKKSLSDVLTKKITAYLLSLSQDEEWTDRFATFGVTGFAKNSEKLYELGDIKSAITSVPYY